MSNNYEIVGYRSKSGKLATYKCTWKGKTKDGADRAKLESFDGKLQFFVDTNKLEPAPIRQNLSGPTKECWECGRTFDYRTCKQNDGEWSDSYCGC